MNAAEVGDAELGPVVELLGELVSLPTVAGRPNGELIALVSARLAEHGVESTVVPSLQRPDGLNLLATVGPPRPGGLLLTAHTDVVDVAGQSWSSDPFTLTRAGDALRGRGTTDMKGFVAAAVCAVQRAARLPLGRPLLLGLSCDEELGCVGVGSLLDTLAALPHRPALCVVGEPTSMRVADRHKGKVRLRVDVRGRAVHSAAAPTGVNAVTHAGRMIARLDDLAAELGEGERDETFSVPFATLSIGPISGGVSTNIVPEECSFEFELRLLPAQDAEPVLRRVRALASSLEQGMRAIAPEAAITLTELACYPALRAAGAPELPVEGPTVAVDFGTEAGLYRERLGIPVVVCGPGDMARAHRADEYIELAELQAGSALLRELIDRLCEL